MAKNNKTQDKNVPCNFDIEVLEMVVAERNRQITEEGWDAKHDREGSLNGQIACAAATYALPHNHREYYRPDGYIQTERVEIPTTWPWAECWWKPGPEEPTKEERLRELTKACALILAEMERIKNSCEKCNSELSYCVACNSSVCINCDEGVAVDENSGDVACARCQEVDSNVGA